MANERINIYDIESLDNVFSLCNYDHDNNHADIYFLCDDDSLVNDPDLAKKMYNIIALRNKGFNGSITLYNLKDEQAARHMAKTFGLSDAYKVNDPKCSDSYNNEFRIICDTDPDFDDTKTPYLIGYNSDNYDMTMLALYFYDTFKCVNDSSPTFNLTTAKQLRQYNDELFLPEFKDNMPSYLAVTWDYRYKMWSSPDYKNPRYIIRKNMKMTGRHADAARLNEKQRKVGLKRLLGMLGYQILESDKLKNSNNHIDTLDQLLDLIAYNMSDCINLYNLLQHPFYKGQFALKKGLLTTYPELIYEKKEDEYAPDIQPDKVRRNRLFLDSSSAQFSTNVLCPYGHLSDIPTVSFMYPSEMKAAELGIPRINVLKESKKFFYNMYPQPHLRAEFDRIYNYYKNIEGRNFNESENYRNDYEGLPEFREPESISSIPKENCCMYYYDKDGNPTSCFVTFSTGGIHGAEYNKPRYTTDYDTYMSTLADFDYVKSVYPNPVDLKKAKTITMPDGRECKATDFLKSGSTLKSATYKDVKPVELFKINTKGAAEQNAKYTYTSADPTQHEDFVSYYPNMLIMLSALYNSNLGYDRYDEIFQKKQLYGKLMKDKTKPESERNLYAILREGTKLILNSASGAADANFESNIRMNNAIISMRIIGQLFTWRIGQAQSYEGAKIISTNTDGLYSVFEEKRNNEVLAREAAAINIEIEPEPVYLISKDTNNRLEMNVSNGNIIDARGGSLGCRKGPNPTKALSHPAVIDWALSEYLICAAVSPDATIGMDKPFNKTIGMNILKSMSNKFNKDQLLIYFQNVLASSNGSITYIFGTKDSNPSDPVIMQHYNRVFIMQSATADTVHLRAATAKKVTPATIAKRQKDGEKAVIHDPFALKILAGNGVDIHNLPDGKEASIKKVTNIEPDWNMLICNKDIFKMSDTEKDTILNNLNYDLYLQLLENEFNKNWCNT